MLSSSAGVLAASGALHGNLSLPLRAGARVWPALQAVAMLAAYLMFFALQRRAEPVTTSFVGYVSMITGTALGAAAFGERLPAIAWPALALIAGSMWLLKRPHRTSQRPLPRATRRRRRHARTTIARPSRRTRFRSTAARGACCPVRKGRRALRRRLTLPPWEG
jgi:hypothetical protein